MLAAVRRGEVWLIKGARERLGLIISSDVFNGTDVPVVIVAEVTDQGELRDSPLAVELDDYVIMPDRLSSPLKRWFVERVAVADTSTMHQISRALRILQDI
jgi:mRNA interferase MazF